MKAVQRMLGHANATMTLDVYADLFDDDLDGAGGGREDDSGAGMISRNRATTGRAIWFPDTTGLCDPTTSRPLLNAGWAANHQKHEPHEPSNRLTVKTYRGEEQIMTTTMWTLLSIFVIAPLGALAFDRPFFGNWIWHIDLETVRDHA